MADYAAVAEKHGLAPDQMALAFVRGRWFVACTIVGATSVDQLERNLGSFTLQLGMEALAHIEAVHARHSTPAP